MLGAIASHYVAAGGGSGYSDEVLADSPLGYWRLGDTSGTTMTDSSGNTRNGTYAGTYTLGATGLVTGDTDKSVDFANGYGDVPNGAWMSPTNITLEALINADTLAAPERAILDRDSSARIFQFRLSGSKLELIFWTTTGGPFFCAGATTLVAGTKYHVAATYDGTTAKVFVNGSQDGSLAQAGSLQSGNTPLAVGASRGGIAGDPIYGRFDGRIDEAAIYGSALSATRIAAHHAAA